MAIMHLFGGGFFVGNKNAGYIINDAKALGARGYTNISANYRLQTQGSWPAQIHDVKAAIRWTRANAASLGIDANKIAVAGYSAGGMLSLMAAGTNGKKEFEGDGGNAGRQLGRQCVHRRVSARERADGARALFPEGQATPENIAAASPTTYISATSRRRSSFTAPRTGRSRCSRASTSSPSCMALGVPTALTLIQGADHAFDNGALDAVEVMAQSIDLFLDRLLVNPKPYPSFGGGRPGGGRPGGPPGGPGPSGGAGARPNGAPGGN